MFLSQTAWLLPPHLAFHQGTYALGASYIALPWWAGMAVFDSDTLTPEIVAITLMYSIAGLGIAIVNDFKSIEGDRKLGLQSIPVQFGVEGAKYITVGTIDGFQLAVAGWLFFAKEEHTYALVLLGLIIPQVWPSPQLLQPSTLSTLSSLHPMHFDGNGSLEYNVLSGVGADVVNAAAPASGAGYKL